MGTGLGHQVLHQDNTAAPQPRYGEVEDLSQPMTAARWDFVLGYWVQGSLLVLEFSLSLKETYSLSQGSLWSCLSISIGRIALWGLGV